jgi:RNA recognition motif-containing protein
LVEPTQAKSTELFILFYLSMNIYLGNLNYKVQEGELQELLEQFGEVTSVKVITDRETGRSKGFGFAEMSDDAAASRAIEELNGADFGERTLVIKEARPREERPSFSRRPRY